MIRIKRIYDVPSEDDGFRILVDRLWPRGMKKETAKIHQWVKEIAPSTNLRKWFNHDPEKWVEFRKRYEDELKNNELVPELVKEIQEKKNVTFLFSTHSVEHNHAIVLKHFLQHKVR